MMTKVYPKISVITPSFNQGTFIEETIRSIIDQGYPNLEYIIIDGGSSDQSVEIIKKYNAEINYWVSEKDSGQSEAINKGLQRATGDIVTWICSDDLLLPGSLFRIAELFQAHPDVGLIHGKTILFADGKKDHVKGAAANDLPLSYFAAIPFPQPSSFFTRKSLDKTGLLEKDLHFAMDYDFFLRMAFECEFMACNDILSRYRLHDDSKSVSKLPEFSREWTYVFSRFLQSVNCPDSLRNKLAQYGYYIAGAPAYSNAKHFTEKQLQKICSLFLFNQLIVWYNLIDKQRSLELIALIKELDSTIYHENKLFIMKWKLILIPDFIFRLLRKLLR